MIRIVILSLVLLASLTAAEKASKAPPTVTVIYSTGLPVESMHQKGVADPDAYTCPTPKESSVATIVDALRTDLRQRGITASFLPAAAVTSATQLIQSPVLVFMGSCHFGNADWGIKKVLDERVGSLAYAGQADRLAKVAIFALGHAEANQGGAVPGQVQRTLAAAKVPGKLAGTYTTRDDTDQANSDVRGQRQETTARLAADIAARLSAKP